MTVWLKHLQVEITDFFFPRVCIECGKIGDFICGQCLKKLTSISVPFCQRCGRPEPSGSLCHECWDRQNSNIDAIRSVFIFDGTIKKAIYDLKYYNLRSISECLGDLMTDYYKKHAMTAELISPVPLHTKRMRERGYNQSALLARRLALNLNIPFTDKIVQRTKDGKAQARTTNVQERKRNMENAFRCDDRGIRGKSIILIDDVCTSGATLEACATALKSAGAKCVTGLTLAREI